MHLWKPFCRKTSWCCSWQLTKAVVYFLKVVAWPFILFFCSWSLFTYSRKLDMNFITTLPNSTFGKLENLQTL